MVEQGTENPRVVGSIPTGGTIISADLAHLVERHLAKVEVAGSSPVIRSKKEQQTSRSAVLFSRLTGAQTRPRAARGGRDVFGFGTAEMMAFSHQENSLFADLAVGKYIVPRAKVRHPYPFHRTT